MFKLMASVFFVFAITTAGGCSSPETGFLVMVSESSNKEISKIYIRNDNFELSFTELNEFGKKNFHMPANESEGTFDVYVLFDDGVEIERKGNAYRKGKGVYITVRNTEIIYVKAHW